MAVPARLIREAKALLEDKGIKLSPRQLAEAAHEAGKGLAETLKFLGELLAAGQGQGVAPEAKEAIQ